LEDVRRQLGRGLRWSAFGQTVVQVGQIPLTLLLVRLLTPGDFGVVGQVAVFTGVAYLLADFGLGAAIVQQKELTDEQLSSVFWLNVVVGVGFSLIYAAAAPFIARFYGDPALVPITIAVGLAFVMTSLRVVHSNLLRRAMNFRHLAAMDALSAIGSLAGAVVLAWWGAGVWALVAQRLLRAGLPAAALWLTVRWRPRWTFRFAPIRGMLRFGGYLLAFNFLNYSVRNADNMLIGKVWGEHILGLYMRAFEFMTLPIEQISQVVTRVVVPALSRLQDDRAASAALWMQGVRWIAFVSFPVMMLAACTAHPLVVTIFGPQWAEAAPLLARFSILGMAASVGTTVGWVYLAQGRSDLMLRWEVVAALLRMGAIGLGLQWGALGVANALLAINAVLFLPFFVIPGAILGLGLGRTFVELWRALSGALLGTACVAAVALAASWLLPEGTPPWVVLVTAWIAGAATYLTLARALHLSALEELRTQVFTRGARPSKA